MSTYLIMTAIVLFLIIELAIGAKYKTNSAHFFDIANTNAMRGFWCMIVILVHIPAAYQNFIQDLLGSFAYIGVTFFFMTSAYGLSLAHYKNPYSINCFWRKRLPKLLMPCLLVNIAGFLCYIIVRKSISLIVLLRINDWVQWLLLCYLFFWISHKFIVERYRDILTCVLVVIFSGFIYILKSYGLIENTTWCTEVFGFVWGIILFHIKDNIIQFSRNAWGEKCFLLCLTALILGITYIKIKTILFFGDYLLKIILGIAIILFILLLNTKISIYNKVSGYLGNISYEVYLLHGIIFGLVASFAPSIQSGMFILVSICITVLVSRLIHIANQFLIKEIKKI